MLTRFNRKSRAQSTAEYAILIGLVIAAAVAMQVYVKRGLQARIHDASRVLVTQTPELDTTDANLQYEPYYLNSSYTVTRGSNSATDLQAAGNYVSDETSNVQRTGGQSYGFQAGQENF
jgi:hypothetical protein